MPNYGITTYSLMFLLFMFNIIEQKCKSVNETFITILFL